MIDTYLGALLSKGSYSSFNRSDTGEIAGWRPVALPVDLSDGQRMTYMDHAHVIVLPHKVANSSLSTTRGAGNG